MDVVVIFALGALLAVVPPPVDRWALRRGASPETLAALAAVTLLGVAAVPVTFVICTGFLAARGHSRDGLSVAAVAGLVLVSLAAGRTIARMHGTRRRWSELSRVTAALGLPVAPGGVKVLPVSELLAFVSGTEAFISQGLVDQLTPARRRAVIEHEREHAQRHHARLLAAARALAHGSFELRPARTAAAMLDRELDALADQAAARRLGDPRSVQDALRALATATANDGELDADIRARIERLSPNQKRRPLVDGIVRIVTLALGALLLASICMSIHTGSAWLGVLACALLVVGFVSFAKPAVTPIKPYHKPEEIPHA